MTLIPSKNHEGIAVVSVGAVFASLAILAFGLRIWAHRIQKAGLNWSDYSCGTGLIFALVLLGITVDITIQGLGLDVTEVKPQQLVNFEKGLIAGTYVWLLSNTFIRMAVLLLYIQLFRTPRFCFACYGIQGLNLIFVIVVILVSSLICRPFALQWDQTLNGSCGNTRAFYLFLPIFNLFMDVMVVILPLPILWRLQMPRNRKVALSAIFGVGIGVCVITTFRIIETVRADLKNPTKDDAVFGVLGLLEPFLGVIGSCLPFLRPVMEQVFKLQWFTRSNKERIKMPTWVGRREARRGETDFAEHFERLNDPPDLESESIGLKTYISAPGKGKV